MTETCEIWLDLVNYIYYARQTRDIYPVLLYSVDFKAPWSSEIHWVRQYLVNAVLFGIYRDVQTSEMTIKFKSNLYVGPVNIFFIFTLQYISRNMHTVCASGLHHWNTISPVPVIRTLTNYVCTLLKILKGTGALFIPHWRGLIQLLLLNFWFKRWSGRMLSSTASKPGVYTKFSGRLSEEPFPLLIKKFACILIFKIGQTGSQFNLSKGQIRLDFANWRPLV